MRTVGSGTVIAATRSDQRPAHVMTLEAWTAPAVVRTRTSRDPATIAVTSVPGRISPPRARTSSASASANRRQSMIPLPGTWSARRPATCGSTSRIPSGPSIRRPSTPFARARSSIVARRGTSSGSVATMSSPDSSYGTPCASAKSRASRRPSAQRRAFREPGAYVFGEWMTPLLRPVWWLASSGSFSSTRTPAPGRRSSSRQAVERPTIPPPTTATSNRGSLIGRRRRRRGPCSRDRSYAGRCVGAYHA